MLAVISKRTNSGIAAAKLAVLMVCLLVPSVAHSGDIPIGNLNLTARLNDLKSISKIRFTRTTKQQMDYSCGAASLATMLTYHYNKPTEESDVIQDMLRLGDVNKIKKAGFSLLDMKLYLQSLGFKADGFRAPLNKLEQVGVPAIVLLNVNGYLHFVLVRGIHNQDVLISDPTLGNRIMNRARFEKAWNGILFVITNNLDIGKNNFNLVKDWKILDKSALAQINSTRQSLGSFTINTSPTPNYF